VVACPAEWFFNWMLLQLLLAEKCVERRIFHSMPTSRDDHPPASIASVLTQHEPEGPLHVCELLFGERSLFLLGLPPQPHRQQSHRPQQVTNTEAQPTSAGSVLVHVAILFSLLLPPQVKREVAG